MDRNIEKNVHFNRDIKLNLNQVNCTCTLENMFRLVPKQKQKLATEIAESPINYFSEN